jgi:hypothetical protein
MFLSDIVQRRYWPRYWHCLYWIMKAAEAGGWSLRKNKFCPRSFYVKFRRRGISGLEKVCVRISDHFGEEEPGPGYYSILVGRSTVRLAEVLRDLSCCTVSLPDTRWPEGEVEFFMSFQMQGESGNPERRSVCLGHFRGPYESRFPSLVESTAWGGGLPARAHLHLLA